MKVSQPPAWLIAFAFASIYLTWGTTYKAMSVGVRDEQLPPLLFGGLRVGCGGLLLLVFQRLRGRSLGMRPGELGWLVLMGVVLFLGGNGLISLGLRTVPSGISSVIAATSPLWMAFLSLLLPYGDRLTLRGWFGLLLGVAGVFVLLADSTQVPASRIAAVEPLDVGLCFASALAWGAGSLMVRNLPLRTERMTAASYQMLFGGTAQLLFGLGLGEAHTMPAAVTWRAPAAFVYLLFVGSLWGFIAYSWLLAHVSAARVGTYAYVNPVIAILIGWASGERLTARLFVGMATILLAVFLVRAGEKVPSVGDSAVPEEEIL